MGKCFALLFLAWFSAEDIREKRLSLTGLVGSLLVGLLYLAACGVIREGRVFCRMLPGMFLLMLAGLTREQIGYGDGLAVLVLGCFLGMTECAAVCGLAFIFSGIFVAVRMCFRKKEAIAFIPFLLGALEVILLVE